MHLLALSGSLRAASTNTALLRALAIAAPDAIRVTVYGGLGDLPLFSPDREGPLIPPAVLTFAAAVAAADGLVISCPEYVHALPGAFKNALDWLVSRPELIAKPVALLHASQRGDDVLTDLRRVLHTVTDRFAEDIFLRFTLRKLTPEQIVADLTTPDQAALLQDYLNRFAAFIRQGTKME